MPSKKRKRRSGVDAEGGEDGDGASSAGAPRAPKRWKSVELDLALMKEFEAEGGLFIEEADEEEVGLAYADGTVVKIGGAGTGKSKGKASRSSAKPLLIEKPSKKAKKKDKVEAAKATKAAAGGAAGTSSTSSTSAPPGATATAAAKTAAAPVAAAAAGTGGAVDVGVPDLPGWVQFELHPALVRGLARLGFHKPTAVQARCLIPAIRQRKDLVGAAETGSGKTLAFGLPILHHILSALDPTGAATLGGGRLDLSAEEAAALRALVVLPTRELAMQVQSHLNAVARDTSVRTECMVGGMSVEKQKRLLRRHPRIVVGTPGRLFALLGLGQEADRERCDWLREGLKGLRHLVLDEADRLVESGHFKELDRVLEVVYAAANRPQQLQTFVFSATLTLNPGSKWQRRSGEDGEKVDALMQRLRFREARAVHTVDLTRPEGSEEPPPLLEEEEERRAEERRAEAGGASSSKSSGKEAAKAAKSTVKKEEKNAAKAPGAGAVAAALGADADGEGVRGAKLPERLVIREAVCSDDKDKEGLLAMWLLRRYRWGGDSDTLKAHAAATTAAGGIPTNIAPLAPTGGLVVLFCNAISSVRRLSSILALLLESPSASKVLNRISMNKGQALGRDKDPPIIVDVLGLHSEIRQKDRMKRMEQFRKLKHAVLVCTDIAARGLDVPDVSAVIHYQVPRTVEIFVHRSGRTARAGRSGESVAFMGPSDAAQWGKIYRAAGIPKARIQDIGPTTFEVVAAKEAARLAIDLESQVHRTAKKTKETNWLKHAAEEADLVLDMDDGHPDDAKAAAAKRQLYPLYRQLQARVRRPPKRMGAQPLSVRARQSLNRRRGRG